MTINGNINVTCNDDNIIKSICIYDNNCSLPTEIATSVASLEAIHNTKQTAHSNLFNVINAKNQEQDSQISSLSTNKADRNELPVVNNATLTITQDGTTKGTFAANASSDVTIDLDFPNINWGTITGTLSSQSDLNTALTSKANNNLSNITDGGNIIISNNAMPSATYVDLTPGADGSQYQAPANGYFVIVSGTASNECWFVIRNTATGLGNYVQAPRTYGLLRCSVAVKKNDYITVDYGNVPLDLVRFVYAVGSESEVS